MRLTLVIPLLLTAIVISQGAQASDVLAKSRTYTVSCSYYASTSADLEVTFHDATLPWGTRVTLVSGLNGSDARLSDGRWTTDAVEWRDTQDTPMEATAPFAWAATRSFETRARMQPWAVDGLAFVFRIRLPDGRETYDNGNRGARSYYLAGLATDGRCLTDARALPPLAPAAVSVVPKN